ncbi:MAG: signal recognition particle receptor subunit alpha [Candidatus Omnitrophica bacterium]|nr:signal recognition particle receptor subunit alpha [Candidatus Omnitrophota bacterium]
MDIKQGLREAFKKLGLKVIVDKDALVQFLREIQISMISADVPVKLVFELTKKIEQQSSKENIPPSISLRDHILKTTYLELCSLLGGEKYQPTLQRKKILLLGLYGSGKTTSAAKLAYFYKSRGLSVALVCLDVDRPAAYEQLEQLAKKVGATFYGIKNEKNIEKILSEIKNIKEEVIIVDSAGRNAFDDELLEQIKKIDNILKPDEKILVISADIGQIAGQQAKEFEKAVKLSGVFITKMDGSGKGGGALAACQQVKIPVMFIGYGEKIEQLEVFDSKKFVGNLLGFPDFETLIEKIKKAAEEENINPEDLQELNFETFYKQLKAAKNIGPLNNILSMMGISQMPQELIKISEEKLKKYEFIISSMTKEERKNPKLLKEQKRIERVAKGSGVKIEEVRELINQFNKMEKAFSGIKKNKGLQKKLEKMFGSKEILDNLKLK